MSRFICFLAILMAGMLSNAQISLEHKYGNTYIDRIALGYDGIKYVKQVLTNNRLELYNSDHSLWKIIDLPVPVGAGVDRVFHISQTQMNADSLIEVIYVWDKYIGPLRTDGGVVFNGVDTLLLVPNANELELTQTCNGKRKIIGHDFNLPTSQETTVYNISNYTIEHTYLNEIIEPACFDNQDIKYQYWDQLGKTVKLYNEDHSSWKSIDLPLNPFALQHSLIHVSQIKLKPDTLIELAFTSLIDSGSGAKKEAVIINEQLDTLLLVRKITRMEFDFPENHDPKIRVLTFESPPTHNTRFYSVPSMALDHNFTIGGVYRLELANNGDVYYYSNLLKNQVEFFDSQFAPWKIVPLELTDSNNTFIVSHISDHLINPDPQIEIAYHEFVGLGSDYMGRIINDPGAVLFSDTGIFQTKVSDLPGFDPKIIAEQYGPGGYTGMPVYRIGGPNGIAMETGFDPIDLSLYPNPVTNKIVASFRMQISGSVKASLIDINGRIASVLLNGNFPKGPNIVSMNVPSSVNNGFYLFKMENRQGISAIPVIIQK